MEYKVAYGYSAEGCGNCLDDLEEEVNNLISAGFKPFGSLQFEHGEKSWTYRAFQPMIKED